MHVSIGTPDGFNEQWIKPDVEEAADVPRGESIFFTFIRRLSSPPSRTIWVIWTPADGSAQKKLTSLCARFSLFREGLQSLSIFSTADTPFQDKPLNPEQIQRDIQALTAELLTLPTSKQGSKSQTDIQTKSSDSTNQSSRVC